MDRLAIRKMVQDEFGKVMDGDYDSIDKKLNLCYKGIVMLKIETDMFWNRLSKLQGKKIPRSKKIQQDARDVKNFIHHQIIVVDELERKANQLKSDIDSMKNRNLTNEASIKKVNRRVDKLSYEIKDEARLMKKYKVDANKSLKAMEEKMLKQRP